MGGNGARSRTAVGGRGVAAGGARGGGGIAGAGFGAFGGLPGSAPPPQAQAQPPTPGAQPTQAGRTSLTAFQSMDAGQTVQYLRGLKQVQMPPTAMLPDADTQKLVYDLGLNGQPRVVSEAEFQKIRGTTWMRGVTAAKDERSGAVLMPGQAVANNTMYGQYSRIGGGVAGDGFYLSNDKGTANSYAGHASTLMDGAVMRAKIDPSLAKPVTYESIRSQFFREPAEVQRAYQNMSLASHWSGGFMGAYAIQKGYNVITRKVSGSTQHRIVLDRSIMIMSDQLTPRV